MPAGPDDPGGRVREHAERFNAAVTTGDWATFARWFTLDASLRFTNAPVPEAQGRAAILTAYEERPPDETLRVLEVSHDASVPDVDVVRFAWAGGERGTMRPRWRGDLVAELEVTFG